MTDTVTTLHLIRHGEAVSNVEPIIGGMLGDTGLTDLGIAQAQALRNRLFDSGEIRPDVIIASTLARARQTAEIIAPAFGDVPVILDDAVQELRPGEADGLHVADFKARYGEPNFRQDPYRPISPGGEYWGQFILRAASALHRIAQEHAGQTIIVVCHGGIIDASFITFFQLPSLALPPVEFFTHNTSITTWERHQRARDGHEVVRWRLLRYNDDEHLRAVGRRNHINWRDVPARASGDAPHQAVPLPTEGEE